MRADGKVAKTVYTGNGVKSIEWIDPPVKKRETKEIEPKLDSKAERPAKD